MKLPSLVLLAAASALPAAAQTKPLHSFSKSVLTREFWGTNLLSPIHHP